MANILIVDDEKDIAKALGIFLSAEGFTCTLAYDGLEALDILKRETIHLVLLDIMMPGMDGITCISRIREFSDVPVIFLSAKSEDVDKIMGLNFGADDYVTKPFNMAEVAARVRSNLRRYLRPEKDGLIAIGGLTLNDESKEVTCDGEEITLTPKEYDILKLLMTSPGKVFSPKEIYRAVWKEEPIGNESTTISVHIRHLREKTEFDPAQPRYIRLVWGQGYKIERG